MNTFDDSKLGWPYPARTAFFSNLHNDTDKKYEYPLEFQDIVQTFPVFSIQIDLPKYRLNNGRTQASQEEYLAKHPEKSQTFFQDDLESIEAQRIQHDILLKMVQKTELQKYFSDSNNRQDQPLILTSEGFVVNGNRRLCEMRELYFSDSATYAHFSHIDVLILPTCTEQDLDELEANLQIQPDIRQEYTWISFACMLRARQLKYKYSDEQMKVHYKLKDRGYKEIISLLTLVDQYLNSRGKTKQYDIVLQNEYAFKGIVKGRKNFRDADKKSLYTELCFLFIDKPELGQRRLYEIIPDIEEKYTKIVDELKKQSQGKITETKVSSIDTSIFGTKSEEQSYNPLIEFITQNENVESVIETIIEVIDSEKETERQQNKASSVLKELTEANTHMGKAISYLSPETSKDGLPQNLDSIEHNLKKIREWLQKNA